MTSPQKQMLLSSVDRPCVGGEPCEVDFPIPDVSISDREVKSSALHLYCRWQEACADSKYFTISGSRLESSELTVIAILCIAK